LIATRGAMAMSRGAIVRDLPVVRRLRVAEILPSSMFGKKV
jgi:hypothetical protein